MSGREQEPEPSPSSSKIQGKGKRTNKKQFFEEPKKLRGFAKHAVLKSYLDAWFPIMLTNYKELVYVDGFADAGIYQDSKKEMDKEDRLGSPLLVHTALAQHTKMRGKTGKVFLIFFEAKKDLCEKLVENLKQAEKDYPIVHKVEIETEVVQGDFNELMDDVLSRFSESPMFLFVDPFGYSMQMSTLQQILSSHTPASPRELFLNLMDGSVRRFLSLENQRQSQDELLGVSPSDDQDDDWREKCKGATPDEKLNIITEFYINRLRQGQEEEQLNKIYALKFAMKSQRNVHVYHLVYVTSHLKGLEVMKRNMSKKSQDPKSFVFSECVTRKNMLRDIKFEKHEIAKDLVQRLLKKFSLRDNENAVYGSEIQKFVWIDTPYPCNVINELKKEMKETGIKFDSRRQKFEIKMFLFPKKTDISMVSGSANNNNQTEGDLHQNQNGKKQDDSIPSSWGNEP